MYLFTTNISLIQIKVISYLVNSRVYKSYIMELAKNKKSDLISSYLNFRINKIVV